MQCQEAGDFSICLLMMGPSWLQVEVELRQLSLCKVDINVDRHISLVSLTLGALRMSIFLDQTLNLATKRIVYQACVLSVLLYGSECWILLNRHCRHPDTFHYQCIRIILGISNHQHQSHYQHKTNCDSDGEADNHCQDC